MMKAPVIMNDSFERLAEVDDFTSFIWTNRYYSAGDFELCVPADKGFSLFQKGFYVCREDDENTGIIESLQIQHNEDDKDILIIKGRFLPAIMERRIIATQTTLDGSISACVNQLITENIIAPALADRRISGFVLGSHDIQQALQAQYTGKNLLETISDICKTYGVGFKTILDHQNQFVFSLYEGVDRTYNQSVNPYVIFSDQYDNLLSSEYEENYAKIATAVLVAGEGEGLDRKTLWVTDGSTDLDRYEVYKDQRNLRSDGGITTAEYEALMREEGMESLTQYTAAFSGKVSFDNIKYKEDVNVGDLVVIENTRWSIYMNTRLVEVIESINEAGEYSIVPTFGV